MATGFCFSRNARHWVAALAICSAPLAGASTLTQSLIQCDASFFQALHEHHQALGSVVSMGTNKQLGWIPVPDRNHDDKASVTFSKPLADGSLHLTGYYDSYFNLGEQGNYYSWGFFLDESREQIIAATPEARWVKAGDEYVSNPRIKFSDNEPWQANTSAASGIAPAKGSMEKVVLLETVNGRSMLTCSVQGSVDAVVLEQERPDLASRVQR